MRVITTAPKPQQDKSLSFRELYEDISRDWPTKSARLQARRWEKLQRQYAA